MSILSFDIGIKNLAYCQLCSNNKILDWGIINISCDDISSISKVLVEKTNDIARIPVKRRNAM